MSKSSREFFYVAGDFEDNPQKLFVLSLLRRYGVPSITPAEAADRDKAAVRIKEPKSPEEKIRELIREQIVRVGAAAKSDQKPGPQVEFPETVQSLFFNADLWLKVYQYRFTPDTVVKHLITPNAEPKDPKQFSVFSPIGKENWICVSVSAPSPPAVNPAYNFGTAALSAGC